MNMVDLINIFFYAAISIILLAAIIVVTGIMNKTIKIKQLFYALGLYAALINVAFQLTLMLFVPFLSPKFGDTYYLVFLIIVVPNVLYNVLSLSNKLTDLLMDQNKNQIIN